MYGLEESQFHDTDIVEAARKSNAHTFITSLADQYETGKLLSTLYCHILVSLCEMYLRMW